MNYIEFYTKFKPLRIFSLQDIRLMEPDFTELNLTLWSQKGYLTKIRNGWYTFAEFDLGELDYYLIANRIYQPSYISLELAFQYYSIIPEGVFQYTSVTTNKTQIFKTPLGVFRYQTIDPKLNWGYKLIENGSQQVKFAELEKALLDFLYLNNSVNDTDDFEGMRFDTVELKAVINRSKFESYTLMFENKSLTSRAYKLLDYISNA